MGIQFESSKDKIKCKILIEEKEVELNQLFKATFIINKDILNYREDLIAYISLSHTYRVRKNHSTTYYSIAKQIIIPFNTYKEYDENNVYYEVDIYIPDYSEYTYNRKNIIKDPNIPTRRYCTLSENQFYNTRCNIGIMRISELNAPNMSKIIKEKSIKLVGQKGFLFSCFRMMFIFISCAFVIHAMQYYLMPIPINENLKLIIISASTFATFIGSNAFIIKVFKVRPTTKPKE